MIDETVHSWLKKKDISPDRSALVVQLTRLPEEKLARSTTVGERLQVMRDHVASRLAEVCEKFDLPAGAVEVMGASDAVIRATPEKLRALVAPDGALAKATDLSVRPNEWMTGVGPGY